MTMIWILTRIRIWMWKEVSDPEQTPQEVLGHRYAATLQYRYAVHAHTNYEIGMVA